MVSRIDLTNCFVQGKFASRSGTDFPNVDASHKVDRLSAPFSILLVEDDDDTRRNLEDILALDGYDVTAVSHCLPAITQLEDKEFDAAIVDWQLPDGSGGDLIPVIAREQVDTPVIVVTGVRDFDTPVEALKNGAYDFLSKPINPDVLRASLSRLVERKRHLKELDEARAKLLANERLAAIGQMVAGLAHESRNAFQRSHACLAELSLDLQDKPDSLKLVRRVQKALDDLNRLLEEVRCYSAPIILERQQSNLRELVERCWGQIHETGLLNKELQFVVDEASDFRPTFKLDPERMCQVISNLLENAIFACAEPGIITVELSNFVDDQQSGIQIAVHDNGSGVALQHRNDIFVPFFTTKTKGTGLGLAISARIVDAHHGTIVVEESKFGGACFVVNLPDMP